MTKSTLTTAYIKKAILLNKSDNRQNTMASELGTSQSTDAVRNWYDEEVRTIVLRRFKTESLYFNNITASDKIDYNTAPDSGTTVDNWTGRQADWYLNMYYQDNDTDYNTSTISIAAIKRNLYVNMIEEGTHSRSFVWVPSI